MSPVYAYALGCLTTIGCFSLATLLWMIVEDWE